LGAVGKREETLALPIIREVVRKTQGMPKQEEICSVKERKENNSRGDEGKGERGIANKTCAKEASYPPKWRRRSKAKEIGLFLPYQVRNKTLGMGGTTGGTSWVEEFLALQGRGEGVGVWLPGPRGKGGGVGRQRRAEGDVV